MSKDETPKTEITRNGTRSVPLAIFQIVFAVACILAGYAISTSVWAMTLNTQVSTNEVHVKAVEKQLNEHAADARARFSDIVQGIKAQHDQATALLQALDKSNALMLQQNTQYIDRLRRLEEKARMP